jgi:hypothetical protein
VRYSAVAGIPDAPPENHEDLARSNLDVLAEEPATYMKRIPVSDSELDKQCIPLDRDLWHVGRYDEFLKERSRLLTASANMFLGARLPDARPGLVRRHTPRMRVGWCSEPELEPIEHRDHPAEWVV